MWPPKISARPEEPVVYAKYPTRSNNIDTPKPGVLEDPAERDQPVFNRPTKRLSTFAQRVGHKQSA